MNKRPLCVAALLWAAVLWLLGQAGIPSFTFVCPKLPAELHSANAAVVGEIYKKEEFTLNTNLYIKKSILNINSKKYPIDNVKVHIEKERCPDFLECGDRVLLSGTLMEIPLPANLGQFNERVYYYARGVKWYQDADSVKLLDKSANRILRGKEKIKDIWRNGISAVIPESKRGFFESILIGEKEDLDSKQKLLFQFMGCSHILAISGMHLSIIGGGLLKILQRLHLPFGAAGCIPIFAMLLYGKLTGGGAAVMRAGIMFSVFVGALILKRTYDFLSAAALACILLLIESPLYLYDSSFLLSFGAILGLGLVYPIFFSTEITQGKRTFLDKVKKSLTDGVKAGLAVWSILLPIMMYFFYEISVWGILVNLVVLPTAGVLLVSGCAGSILGIFCLTLPGKLAAAPAVVIVDIYLFIGKIVQKLPMALWITGKPEMWKCVCYYGILFLLLWIKVNKKWKKSFFCILAVRILFLYIRMPWEKRDITFLDVGQGDCACIHTGKRSCFLIDGGSSSVSGVGKYRILPFLKAYGIQEIEGIFVSHTDADHINGIQEILESISKKETQMKIGTLFLSECKETEEKLLELETEGKKAGCRVVYVRKGTRITGGKVTLECLAPGRSDFESNEGSQVFKMTKGRLRVLFTGDIEGDGETELLKILQKKGENYDVLKVAHHGSKNSTTEEILETIMPCAAIISCGENNSYGHPHKELKERLKAYTQRTFMTMTGGEISLSEEKKGFCIQSRLGEKRYLFTGNEP